MIEKILLDTDIGTDIDDAIVMSYLLKQKKCEIVGITVTGGETEKRAALASVMCHAAGKPDIPIYPGPNQPLFVKQKECLHRNQKSLIPGSIKVFSQRDRQSNLCARLSEKILEK